MSSKEGGTSSTPDRGAKTPHASQVKNQNIKNRNIVTYSIKTLKMVHIKKNFLNRQCKKMVKVLCHMNFVSIKITKLQKKKGKKNTVDH